MNACACWTGANNAYTWCPVHNGGASMMSTHTMRATQTFQSWNVALGWALNLWRNGHCEGKPSVRRVANGWCVSYKPRYFLINSAAS